MPPTDPARGANASQRAPLNQDNYAVSFLRTLGESALRVLQIYDTLQSNQEAFRALKSRVDDISRDILDQALNAPEYHRDARFREDIEALQKSVTAIAKCMEPFAQRSVLRRVTTDHEIRKLEDELERSYRRYKSQSALRLQLSLLRLTEDHAMGRSLVQLNADSVHVPSDLPTTRLPARPANFVGRTDIVQAIIHVLLTQVGTHIAILGAGGIGKTAVASIVLHDDRILHTFENRRFFITCEGDTSNEAVVAKLASKLQVSVTSNVAEAVLLRLQSMQQRTLIVLDNLESVWEAPDRMNVEAFLTDLCGIEMVTLLITMRGRQKPHGPRWASLDALQPLHVEEAKQLFKNLGGSEDGNLEKLLLMLDCWPLAIVLMATIAQSGSSPSYLLQRYQDEHTAMLSNGCNHKLSNLEVSIEVSLQSHAMQQVPIASTLLSLLSLLPDGIVHDSATLTSMFPHLSLPQMTVQAAANTLLQTALAYLDNTRIRILSPIRIFMLHHSTYTPQGVHLMELQKYYSQLIGHTSQLGHTQAGSNMETVSSLTREIGNIQAMLFWILPRVEAKETILDDILSAAQFAKWTRFGYSDGLLLATADTLKDLPSYKPYLACCLLALGGSLYRQSKYTEASNKIEAARELYQELLDEHGEIHCLSALGDIKRLQGRLREASKLLKAARKLCRRVRSEASEAQCMLSLGEVRRLRRQFTKASSILTAARPVFQRIGKKNGEADCMWTLGEIMRAEGDYDNALIMLHDARSLCHKIWYQHGEAACMLTIGEVLCAQHQFGEALSMLKTASLLYQQINDQIGEALCMLSLGKVQRTQSDYVGAAATFEAAMVLFQKTGDQYGEADCLLCLSDTMTVLACYKEGIEHIGKAVLLYQKLTFQYGVAQAEASLGHILCLQGHFTEAAQILQTARLACQGIGNQEGEAHCTQSLGEISRQQDKYEDAYTLLKEAKSLFHNVGSQLGVACCMWALGEVLCSQSRLAESSAMIAAAMSLFQQIGNQGGEADCTWSLGNILCMQGQYSASLKKLETAMAIYQKTGNQRGVAYCLWGKGNLQYSQRNYAEASISFHSAWILHKQIGNPHGEAQSLTSLGELFCTREWHTEAVSFLKEAGDLYKRMGNEKREEICRRMGESHPEEG